jgi:hypothetical protein
VSVMSSNSAGALTRQTRQRLHSLTFHWLRRTFAVLLAADALRACLGLWSEPPVGWRALSTVLHVGTFLLLALILWFRGRTVFATDYGLELVSGGVTRVVPWPRLIDLRETPWMTLHPPWYPKLYQLDLLDDESLDFIDRRNAVTIVRAAQQRAKVGLAFDRGKVWQG